MLKKNCLKEKLTAGKRVFGTWSMLGSASLINTIGYSGLDFVIIDMEHGPMSYETVENQLYAAEVTGLSPIVRLGEGSESSILHALEIGAQSIMVSHVSTSEDAQRIVNSCLYQPEGDRGLSPFTRNHGYSDYDLAAKLKHANEQMFIGVLVEGKQGLDNLEKICKIPKLDMVYLGIYDLSQSLGVSGDVRHPKVIKLVKECVKIIGSNGKVAGSVARDKDYIKLLFDAGFRFISYRCDSAVLRDSLAEAQGWYDKILIEEKTQ